MTIEEYLKSEISGRKSRQLADGWMMTDHAYEYHEGYIAALEEISSKLPEMEHEVTLREVMTFCRKRHEGIDSPKCKGCSLWSTKDDCCLVYRPYWIPVDEVERRMKEASND